MSVDLPAPFSPTRPTMLPRSTSSVMPSRTVTPKKALWTSSKRRIGVSHARAPHALCSRMRRRATSMRAAKRMTEPFTMAT